MKWISHNKINQSICLKYFCIVHCLLFLTLFCKILFSYLQIFKKIISLKFMHIVIYFLNSCPIQWHLVSNLFSSDDWFYFIFWNLNFWANYCLNQFNFVFFLATGNLEFFQIHYKKYYFETLNLYTYTVALSYFILTCYLYLSFCIL